MISGLLIGFVIGALATVAGLIAVGKRHLKKQSAKHANVAPSLSDHERIKHVVNYSAGCIQMPYVGHA